MIDDRRAADDPATADGGEPSGERPVTDGGETVDGRPVTDGGETIDERPDDGRERDWDGDGDEDEDGNWDGDGNRNEDDLELTAEQRDALVLDRNVAITAGAGTGKTTTLTERYVTILEKNPDLTPENVVTITFTRKAAAELTERVREEIYERLAAVDSPADYRRWRDVLDELEDGYVHTIHAFCTRLLREHAVEAPVPLGFDVLDEEGTTVLQREVVTDYLERNEDDADVALLARQWRRDRLVEILVGLLDERPESEAVLEHWREADADAYADLLWEVACDLDADEARETLYEDGVLDRLRALEGRLPGDGDDVSGDDTSGEEIADADGLRALEALVDVADRLPDSPADSDPRECQRAICDLFEVCEKKSGGVYSSAGYVVGSRSDWGTHGDVYDDLKDTVDALIDAVEPYEDAVETTPGALEEHSARYAMALLRVFDDVLERYEAEKDRRDALDFPDLIETTIGFLEANEDVREGLREGFAAVMVDEFQDTDPRQWLLVKLLTGIEGGLNEADEADETATTAFLVGDEKQSIYAFRGADVTTFGTARDELEAVNDALGLDDVPGSDAQSPTGLELSGNFRTLEQPLTFLNELFDDLFRPEGDDHEPFEARPQPLSPERERIEETDALEGSVEYLVVPDDEETAAALFGDDHPVAEGALDHSIEAEARALAARLTRLFADPPTVRDLDDGTLRDARPADVAILLRRRTHLDRYQRALEACEIPYTVLGGSGFYDTPEVQALTNLLRVLGDPTDDVSLYGVLRSPLFGVTDDRLAAAVADADSVWEALAETTDPQLADASDLLTTWRTLAGCATPGEEGVLPWDRVLSRVIDDTGYLASVSADERGRQAVANVEKFRERVRTWSENGIHTAAGLLHRIDRRAEIDPREGEATVPGDAEGVRIMTIHAAKGLEFPVVTVPDVGSTHDFGRSVDGHGYVRLVEGDADAPPFLAVGGPDPNDAFSLEKTAAHEYASRRSLPRERAEAKRLLYVACTRVRDHLLLCGTHDVDLEDGGVTLGEPAPFDEATRWRDWLQPVLLDDDLLATAITDGSASARLGGVPYTVRLPPRPVAWAAEEEETAEQSLPSISIPTPPEGASATRVAATTLVSAVAERADGSADSEGSEQGDVDAGETAFGGTEKSQSQLQSQSRSDSAEETRSGASEEPQPDGLSPTTFGTVVHRLAELRPPRAQWDPFVRRVSGMAGETPTDADLRAAVDHAEDAVSFVEDLESSLALEATHDEYSVVARLDDHRIVGDIDRLLVTPDAYHIVDYKTNDLSRTTSDALADHYRPQLLSYALALMQHDPDRDVRASLRFTDAGVDESFAWRTDQYDEIETELRSMLEAVV